MDQTTESKTPRFDAALDAILSSLKPETRDCRWRGRHPHCESTFNLVAEDIEFLTMLRVPPPNFCPTCRRIRRLVHYPVFQLFRRPCDAPGHGESMISILPADCPFPVYDYEYFTGDEFDPFQFGTSYTAGSPLATLLELRREFPMPSFLNRDPSSINSDYSNGGRNLKNGYFVAACFDVQDAWYSTMLRKSSQIMDSRTISFSERVYEGVQSDHLYNSSFVYFSSACSDSMFLYDCRNCSFCFGCVNLRNKQYCIWNEQVTKEQYKRFITQLYPLKRSALDEYKQKFWALVKSLPMNASRIVNSQDVTGVMIRSSKDMYDVTDAENSEHVRHSDGALNHKDSMDMALSGGFSSRLYGTTNVGSQSSNVRFSVATKFSTDCEFVFNSKSLTHCFMCFGLQNKSYCLLNRQYESDGYFRLVDQLKTEMLERGEYADGLGFEFSALPYNISSAGEVFPLDELTVRSLGGYTTKIPDTNVSGLDLLAPDDVPQTIDEVDESITSKAIRCAVSGRPFRIEPTELAFYLMMRLPLPVVHPSVRMERRHQLVPQGRQYQAICQSCGRDIRSIVDPTKEFTLYCPDCYRDVVS